MLRYGREGRREKLPANVAASEATTADDIFTKLSKDILKVMLAVINIRGSNGAPSQPETWCK